MSIDTIGWDIGGAHLKAVAVDRNGGILRVIQEPCPLWLGLDRLDSALNEVMARLSPGPGCRHAATMTGELADAFEDRGKGVAALVQGIAGLCPPGALAVFAGPRGFLAPEAIGIADAPAIASANWLASGFWVAAKMREALFVDVGSTTTDLLAICGHEPAYRGYTDCERMRYDELLYTGIVRTAVMALARRVPFDGEWLGLMAEQFATTADIYRLTGELPAHADQMATADGGAKTVVGSRRRLARMLGRDADSASDERWRAVAAFLRERQLRQVDAGLRTQLSRGLLGEEAPLIGAGVGRFLVRELARRLRRPYLDCSDLFSMSISVPDVPLADCVPAAAVACLAMREAGRE